jgi:hypothetical protein
MDGERRDPGDYDRLLNLVPRWFLLLLLAAYARERDREARHG